MFIQKLDSGFIITDKNNKKKAIENLDSIRNLLLQKIDEGLNKLKSPSYNNLSIDIKIDFNIPIIKDDNL
jgi:hypothetical protein